MPPAASRLHRWTLLLDRRFLPPASPLHPWTLLFRIAPANPPAAASTAMRRRFLNSLGASHGTCLWHVCGSTSGNSPLLRLKWLDFSLCFPPQRPSIELGGFSSKRTSIFWTVKPSPSPPSPTVSPLTPKTSPLLSISPSGPFRDWACPRMFSLFSGGFSILKM